MNVNVNDYFKYVLEPDRQIYLVVSKGSVNINAIRANKRDGVRIIYERNLNFIFQGNSELIILDLPNIS
jgi:redox-sensitive bicupin YhaK (pirin superfamily)